MKIIKKPNKYKTIPVKLTLEEFNEFILPHIPMAARGPKSKISLYKTYNYILQILYTGCQWKSLPIRENASGEKEIHHTTIFKTFKRWIRSGLHERIFENSVINLHNHGLLDLSTTHGDGTTTIAKKGGDCLGYSGHKHYEGEKMVAFVDRNCNVLSPFISAPGNCHETRMFADSFSHLKRILKMLGESLSGIIVSLDSAYDSRENRKKIFNAGMIPNIKENPRNRKTKKRGRKRIYSEDIFEERFSTVERAFAWEDKFKRLLMRFERISLHHFGMKLIAYTMINLRHFCK